MVTSKPSLARKHAAEIPENPEPITATFILLFFNSVQFFLNLLSRIENSILHRSKWNILICCYFMILKAGGIHFEWNTYFIAQRIDLIPDIIVFKIGNWIIECMSIFNI